MGLGCGKAEPSRTAERQSRLKYAHGRIIWTALGQASPYKICRGITPHSHGIVMRIPCPVPRVPYPALFPPCAPPYTCGAGMVYILFFHQGATFEKVSSRQL